MEETSKEVPVQGISAMDAEISLAFPCIIVLGMAGSGKSSFVQRLNSYLREKMNVPYLINLDPAAINVAYPANIDIRDTVKYKAIMEDYNLGPNGAIMTCLNLLCTKFDQILTLLQNRSSSCSHCLLDTPGQIEAFTWSASGSIITDTLASSFPTLIAYVVDSARAANPVTFMSNMLYACSIMYRTKLPLIVVLNKSDIVYPTFAMKWMQDFEVFDEAIESNKSSFINDLTRSLSLVLDEFYEDLPCVAVSSLTGEGFDRFLDETKKCVTDYYKTYRPMYETLKREMKQKRDKEEDCVQQMENLSVVEKGIKEDNRNSSKKFDAA